MEPPIFLCYEGDVMAFNSVEAAENYAEPPDVEHDEFVAYDATGRLLFATCQANRIKLSPSEDEPKHVAELETTLRRFLNAIGRSADVDAAHSLPDLVMALSEFVLDSQGLSRNRHI